VAGELDVRQFGKLSMQIFISHSSKDKLFVRKLSNDLKAIGYPNWLDEIEIKVGDSIPELIHHALANACAVIVAISFNSNESKWVQREVNSVYFDVVEGRKKLFPVLIEDVVIPENLRDLKYADFRESYENGFKDLVMALPKEELIKVKNSDSSKELSYEQIKYLKLSKEHKLNRINDLMNEWFPSTLAQDNYHLISWLETYHEVEKDSVIIEIIELNLKKVEANLPFSTWSIEGWR